MDERVFWFLQGGGLILIIVLLGYLYFLLRRQRSHLGAQHDHILFLLREVEGEKAVRLKKEEDQTKKKRSKHSKTGAMRAPRAARTPSKGRRQ